ncbi:tripartite tricarboxylate transporter TctB family protein [Rhodobacteraceae bacterium M385]|nr:tripartite tricarboxylate transporter TctB family protein [Rhodobacteraceae bacterium M385]
MNQTSIVGGVLTVFGIATTMASFQINLTYDGGWGARIFPLASGAAILVLGVVELTKGLIERQQTTPKSYPFGVIASLLALALVYAFLIGAVGYLISTAIVAPLSMLLFGVRDWRGLMAAAVLCPAIYHLIFFEGLGVFPPFGRWFDLLDVIQGY